MGAILWCLGGWESSTKGGNLPPPLILPHIIGELSYMKHPCFREENPGTRLVEDVAQFI